MRRGCDCGSDLILPARAGKETPYPGMTHWTHAASDHAAIVAEFAV